MHCERILLKGIWCPQLECVSTAHADETMCTFTTYFMAAVDWLVREHVVINFRHRWLPGDESAAVVDLTGRQVQGCVHGCRKERKPGSHKDFQNLFSIDRLVILGQGRFFCGCNISRDFFFFGILATKRIGISGSAWLIRITIKLAPLC